MSLCHGAGWFRATRERNPLCADGDRIKPNPLSSRMIGRFVRSRRAEKPKPASLTRGAAHSATSQTTRLADYASLIRPALAAPGFRSADPHPSHQTETQEGEGEDRGGFGDGRDFLR